MSFIIATFFGGLFDVDRFMPHGHCYQWDPGILWTSVISDALIAAAYIGIPFTLVFKIMRKRGDLPFNWMFTCFGIFIVACGCTHVMEIITIWHPFYAISDLVKAITAAASVSTALILYRIAPKIVSLPTVDQMVEEKTRRLRAEASSEAKDRFIASLSHELRTPLTPVTAALDLVEEELARQDWIGLSDSVQSAFRMIRQNLNVETALINDLIDFSASGSKKMILELESVDLGETVRATLRTFQDAIRRKGILIIENFEAAETVVLGAPVRLQQIVKNLFDNAVKYTPVDGTINLRLTHEADRLQFTITDNGRGIAEEDLEKIFQPFEQLEWRGEKAHSGMGLGLTVARAMAEAQGGRLIAKSQGIGRGASFRLDLAATKQPVPRGPIKVTVSEKNEKPHLLVVDDHPDTLQIVAALLRRAGYSVLTAETVAEAEESLDACEILVSDIGLPDGNGWELMQRFKAQGGRAGIAISGFGQEEDIRRSHAAGFAEHLVKPIEIASLIRALQSIDL